MLTAVTAENQRRSGTEAINLEFSDYKSGFHHKFMNFFHLVGPDETNPHPCILKLSQVTSKSYLCHLS